MGSHMIDSKVLGDFFGTEEMREVYSDKNLVQKWLDVEAALAKVQAELQIVPKEAAVEIIRKANIRYIDMERLRKDIVSTVHPIVPLINQLNELCVNDYGQYIHWGATTQDIMDTGAILQMKEALQIIEKKIIELMNHLSNLAKEHKDTVMIGRTHGQQALPITLGFKVAVWLDEIHRHYERLQEIKPRVLKGQFSGAVGTLASLPETGIKVHKKLMEELGLNSSSIAWHNARDTLAEIATFMGMVTGTTGKIANEIVTLQKTEKQELEEPFNLGKVGSSTMPHKRNPMLSESVVSLSRIIRTNCNLMLEGMIHEHERDMVPWMVEWEVIPEIFILSSANLATINMILSNLQVNKDKMHDNLMLTKGLILSETIMLALGEKIGRQKSHDLIYGIAMSAYENNEEFAERLLHNEEIEKVFSEEEIQDMLDPARSIGVSVELTEQILAKVEKSL